MSGVDIELRFDGEYVAGIVLDDVQDAFPWYRGNVVDGDVLGDWREFVDAYHAADLEFDYCPHHPREGPYEDTDLAPYAAAVSAIRDRLRDGATADPALIDPWPLPSATTDPEWYSRYASFLDYRRWQAVTPAGETVVSVPLPPSLDLRTRRYAFRPAEEPIR